jgi:pimeloyl-ACP methyl ester carboxylesterase
VSYDRPGYGGSTPNQGRNVASAAADVASIAEAYVAPWGYDPGKASQPVLFVHGGQDRIVSSSHAEWLARRVRSSELWLRPDGGHVSVLSSGEAALEWLRAECS